jgi:DNA-directed RNA polymerase subunit RPC12/RpoP
MSYGFWAAGSVPDITGKGTRAVLMRPEWNYVCDHCGAKLRQRMSVATAKGREQAYCPHCFGNLPPRQGKHTLGYELIEPPPKPAA